MIPISDENPTTRTPIITWALIIACVVVFLWQLSLDERESEAVIRSLGFTPRAFFAAAGSGVWLTVFTSMFLHGGLLHLGGNMLYLWIFGNNVEDTLGHLRFAVFYLASGIVAVAAQTAINPDSAIPMVGASGAVSGVLGAYLLLFPYATVLTLVTVGFFIRFVHVPALLVLGFWIVFQFVQGYLSLHVRDGGGVAFFAHVGGFVAGMVLLFVMRP